MIPDLDIYRSAQVLMKRHGPDAPIHAAMRADAMLDKSGPRHRRALDPCALSTIYMVGIRFGY